MTEPGRADGALLSVADLGVAAGGERLLAGVGLTLRAREVVVLGGPSGAGKTSLLRAIAGLVDPTAGTVRLEGRTPCEVGWPAFRRRVVYVAQEPRVHDETVAACLRRPFTYDSADGAGLDLDEARAHLARLGLPDDVEGRLVRRLSVGERQRVALARALLVRPRVLLLDEPVSGLDPDRAASALALVAEWAEGARGAALLVTHDVEAAGRFATRRLDLGAWRASQGDAS